MMMIPLGLGPGQGSDTRHNMSAIHLTVSWAEYCNGLHGLRLAI